MKIDFIFFDLDNTLHSFSNAYKQATSETFKEINREHPNLKIEVLASAYSQIQKKAEKRAFIDKKTSFEYRFERFNALLQHFGIDNSDFVEQAVNVYGATIEESMKPNPDVHELLSDLKQDFTLCLVSEGPSDAQRKALRILELEQFFPKVFLSSEASQIKEDGGLFQYALDELDCLADRVIHVGDSWRDILGAHKTGIKVIWYNPKEAKLLEGTPEPDLEVKDIKKIKNTILQVVEQADNFSLEEKPK